VYAATTGYNVAKFTCPTASCYTGEIDAMSLPPGTYLITLSDNLYNANSVETGFSCEIHYTNPTVGISGAYPPGVATVAANHDSTVSLTTIETFTETTTVSQDCFATSTSGTSWTAQYTLLAATQIGTLHSSQNFTL
jgi:hypothetical protein